MIQIEEERRLPLMALSKVQSRASTSFFIDEGELFLIGGPSNFTTYQCTKLCNISNSAIDDIL